MTVAVPPDVPGRAAPFCSLCGHPMEADQEWCLNCGAARTVIARAPDWRVPVLVIGAVVLLIAGVLIFAVLQLTSSAGKVSVVSPTAAARPTATVAAWAPGLDGYTVLLAAEPSQASALDEATHLQARQIADVGVLDRAQHPEMAFKGPWLVFSGRYPSFDLARAAAAEVAKRGEPQAAPALVQRAGG